MNIPRHRRSSQILSRTAVSGSLKNITRSGRTNMMIRIAAAGSVCPPREHHDGGCKTEIKDKACETVCIEPGLFGVKWFFKASQSCLRSSKRDDSPMPRAMATTNTVFRRPTNGRSVSGFGRLLTTAPGSHLQIRRRPEEAIRRSSRRIRSRRRWLL